MAETLYGGKTWKQILDTVIGNIYSLCEIKGAEYAASDKDQLANFRRRADRFKMPMEAAWVIYAGKHWDAIETYITDLIHKRERPRSEPLDGRVDDMIVYLILFKAMLAERATVAAGLKPLCSVCGAIAIEQTFGCMRKICPITRGEHVIQSGQTDRT